MLQLFRRMANTWVFKILMVLLIISFGAIFNVSDFVGRVAATKTVIQVGSEKISGQDTRQHIAERIALLEKDSGRKITTQQAIQMGVLQSIIEGMIMDRLFKLEAENLGLVVTDGMINKFIQTAPQFKNKAGQFDVSIFRQYLSHLRLSESQYADIARQELTRSQIAAVLNVDPLVFKETQEAYLQHMAGKRTAKMMLIKSSDQKTGKPSEEALKEIYTQNQNAFMAPEIRDFSVLTIDAKKVAKKIVTIEADLKAEYEQNKALYPKGLKDAAAEIKKTLSGKKLTQKLYALSQDVEDAFGGGVTMAEVAKTFNLDITTHLETERSKVKLDDKIIQAAFTQVEEVEGPSIETKDGSMHFVRVDKITPTSPKPYETVKKEVVSMWERAEKAKLAQEKANDIKEKVSKGQAFDAVAKSMKLVVSTKAGLNRHDALKKDPKNMESLGLVEAVFSLKKVNDVTVSPSKEGAWVVQYKSQTPATVGKGNEELRKNIDAAIKQGMSQDLGYLYITSLRKKYKVSVDQKTLMQVLS